MDIPTFGSGFPTFSDPFQTQPPAADTTEQLSLLSAHTNLTLICTDGHQVPVLRDMLTWASPVLRDMLSVQVGIDTLRVEDDSKPWNAVLPFLYPDTGAELTWDLCYEMLPLAHKYDMQRIIKKCLAYLTRPNVVNGRNAGLCFTSKPNEPSFVLRWLDAAEKLQLQPLLTACLQYVREQAAEGRTTGVLGNDPAYITRLSKDLLEQLLMAVTRIDSTPNAQAPQAPQPAFGFSLAAPVRGGRGRQF